MALLVYLALACLLARTVLPHFSAKVLGSADFHVWDHLWHCWWANYSMAHGGSPFFCPIMDFPRGVNVLREMTTLAFPFLSIPLQWVFGLVGAYNAMAILSLALAGWGGYLVCRQVAGNPGAALLGGVIYGFSPFMQVELSNGMMEQVLGTALLPYFMLALLSINDRPRAGNIAGACVLLALLVASSLFSMVFAAAVVPFCLAHGWMGRDAGGRKRLLAAYEIIGLVGLLVVLGAVIGLTLAQADAMRHVSWRSFATHPVMKNKVCLDVLQLLFPDGAAASGRSADGSIVLVPFGVYLGKIMMLLSALALVMPFRAWRPWKAGLVVSLLLALGPFLNVGGRTEFIQGMRIPMPDSVILTILPQATRLLATHNYRFISLVMLFGAVLTTLLLGAVFSRLGTGAGARRTVVAALCGFTLLDFGGSIESEPFLALPSADARIPAAYGALAGQPEGAVLDVPLPFSCFSCIGLNGRLMFYQTSHHRAIWFGGADTPKAAKLDRPLLRAIRVMSVRQDWSLEDRDLPDDGAAVSAMGFGYLAVHRHEMARGDYLRFTALVERHGGEPIDDADGVAIYRLPPPPSQATGREAGAGQQAEP